MYSDLISVRDFGALPDGKTDCSSAIKQALAQIPCGGTLYFPRGEYLVEQPVTISISHLKMVGDGRQSHIIYTYDQKDSDSDKSSSLFYFPSGTNDIRISELQIEYRGRFFEKLGESYSGKISAFYFSACDDVVVEKIEIFGFNANGIFINGTPDNYAKRCIIDKCYLHHNRVAGVLYGYVDGISLTNNAFEYHGSPYDGGTGYGCAGWSGGMPKNIQVIGNRASYNYRKGIDLHAGESAVIEGNICDNNLLYGIYVEGPNTKNAIIRGNIISNMVCERLPYNATYNWNMAISFGVYSETKDTSLDRNYIINDNEILNFSFTEGDAWPIYAYYSQTSGMIQIKNNIIRAKKITNAVALHAAVNHSFHSKVCLDISGNQIFCERCINAPFDIDKFDSLTFRDNRFNCVGECGSPAVYIPGHEANTIITDGNVISCGSFVKGNHLSAENDLITDKLIYMPLENKNNHTVKLYGRDLINGALARTAD
ncbi:MAG: glycosyl hydrolase family 28-related protein [Oscillospiraceae bacterium]|nr:glycosyl hydrolase family 28-related protein [Oscillospiraceae bacterium]